LKAREYRANNIAFVDLVKAFAARKGCTPGQVALSWLLARRPWIVPIPGTSKAERMQENAHAPEFELTQAEERELTTAADKLTVQGHRYSELNEKYVNR
jgi:aryl-alcohol dehydrogenase-like predicted oxidoreductase